MSRRIVNFSVFLLVRKVRRDQIFRLKKSVLNLAWSVILKLPAISSIVLICPALMA
jgi:hypothetical protein